MIPIPRRKQVWIAAHRGTSGGNIPCNTLAAYSLALADGADVIELDVASSRDGELFCFHPGKEHVFYGDPTPAACLCAAEMDQRFLRNQDLEETEYHAPRLDDALELIKNRAIVAVDKFWLDMPRIASCIRRHGMEDQVLCKLQNKPALFRACAQIAPDLPVMPVIWTKDNTAPWLDGLRVAGVEALFSREEDPIASPEYIAAQHAKNRLVWVNAIVYNKEDILSAGHSDDAAVRGDRESGWGWLIQRGFDIIQTDFTAQLSRYRAER